MIRELLAIFSLLFLLTEASSNPTDSKTGDKLNTYRVNQIRSFESIDSKLSVFEDSKEVKKYFNTSGYVEPSSSDESVREQIKATFDKVTSENRFVKFLDQSTLLELPVGIKTEIGELEYTILIDSVIATPNTTLLYASMKFEAPNLGEICFRGADINFSKEGGILDGAKLELVGDYDIDMPGGNSKFVIKGSKQKTYVEFDCNGFKQMSLDASFEFSRDLMVPLNNKGVEIPNENVALSFTTVLTDWNNLLIEASLPNFEMKGLDDVIFSVKNAVFDFSDSQNAGGITFPTGYSEVSSYLQSGTPELWRGVFIKSLTVTLPQQFETTAKDTTAYSTRVSFSGTNMLIDEEGFSGIISANNLIPIEDGKIGNWDFSLDALSISLMANSITEGSFSGKVDIPISSKDSESSSSSEDSRLFKYSALISSDNEYVFNVSNPEKIEFSLWNAADVELKPSSYVEISLKDGSFLPKAHLSGTLSITAGLSSEDGSASSSSQKNIALSEISFTDLEIQSVKPYVSIGAFSLGTSNDSMGGFPISLNKLGGGQDDDELYLEVDLTLSLTDAGFAAGGGVRIITEAVEDGNDLGYKFKEVEIQRFSIDIDQGAFKFSGNLNFYKGDDVYGNGISGTVSATFGDNISLEASAIFGNVNSVKYWYVDALVTLGQGIPIFTGVYMHQFGGGASYHMELATTTVASTYGKTASGIVYVPNKEAGLGLKAMVGIRGEDEKMFHADATFEMAFRTGGGLRYINFRGNAYLLTEEDEKSEGELSNDAKKMANATSTGSDMNSDDSVSESVLGTPDTKGASIYAGILITYDFENKTLHANLDVIIDVADGVLTGGGNAVMHFSSSEWYIYIGRPEYENRFSLELLGLARSDAYFVMGSVVPDTPDLPSNVLSILGDLDLGYMDDLNALADGAGIGFGASVSIDTGDQSFLIFYGSFEVGLGFDVMLKNYGDATCSGRGGLGIDGWYANGQAYAYFEGKIGVKVKLFRKTKKIDILNIGAAVVLQAKLPNPIWAKGVVGGHFSALGGLVKGDCSFEVVIGEECDLQNTSSVLEGIDVIAELTPQSGTSDVDVFTSPQAVFNYELEKSYYTKGYDDEDITFKIALDSFVVKGPDGAVDVDLVWNEDNTIAVIKPNEILPPETELTMIVVTSFQELNNNVWEATISDGEELKERRSITFTTGEAPDYIPDSNIAYCYPVDNMLNFYKSEYNQGYVMLNTGQAYLFADEDYTQIVRLSTSSGDLEVSLTYSVSNKEVTYSIPSELVNDKIYEVSFVSVPELETDIEANVTTSETELEGDDLDATVTTRSASGSVTNYEEQELYSSYFRTSKYSTFKDKVESVNPSSGWRASVYVGVHLIGSNISGPEPFSYEEMFGVDGENPLVRFEADLTDNSWYDSKIYPLLYEDYPLPGNLTIPSTVRDVSVFGIVPTKAIQLVQYPYNFTLDESDINLGSVSFGSSGGYFEYQLAYYMYKDYVGLKNLAANYLYNSSSSNSTLSELVESSFPPIEKGDYYMNVNYVLPGRESITSTYRHKIYNPIE